MTNQPILDRLKRYNLLSKEQEEHALKEIFQEITLYALSTTDFFDYALFQGGTCLRILYQLPRFSEDLDFILKNTDANFSWKKYIMHLTKALSRFDIEAKLTDRSETSGAIKRLFLKDQSIGQMIYLKFQHHKKLMIKLEIDTNPPSVSQEELMFLDFPIDYSIQTQDLPSNFAGKCHALLCRDYVKGRDWFDFIWYVNKETLINFSFLEAAINQHSPWKNQSITVNKEWLIKKLHDKINHIDWKQAVLEVQRFVNHDHHSSLSLWDADFFRHKLKKLASYL